MKPLDAVRAEQRLDNLFKRVSTLSYDPEMQSHWARYLCVLVSGYLEMSLIAVYRQYTQTRAEEKVVNYVTRNLSRFQNPNMERICQLVGSFNQNWEEELRLFVDDEVKDSIDSIVANRNQISHGKDVGITYITMNNYYQNAKRLVEFLSEKSV